MELCNHLFGVPSTAIENVSLTDCARSPSSRTFFSNLFTQRFRGEGGHPGPFARYLPAFACSSQRCNKRLLASVILEIHSFWKSVGIAVDALFANRIENFEN